MHKRKERIQGHFIFTYRESQGNCDMRVSVKYEYNLKIDVMNMQLQVKLDRVRAPSFSS